MKTREETARFVEQQFEVYGGNYESRWRKAATGTTAGRTFARCWTSSMAARPMARNRKWKARTCATGSGPNVPHKRATTAPQT